ncbi:MAG: 1-acyl-sn-glycerol-3-phosphate acyltransferase [Deltaproteobacteria bacterium]|nr:1-acyl-sn-glycerol-3-phosphate acyltransferase [Deltaproteobacteria bacterium]MCW5802469.1 1-acyl-sn-glycerol-3-phosphate acyltransferase [Deltaproteobacteria bacterium]
MPETPKPEALTRVEQLALRFAEAANERPSGKWLQTLFLRGVSYAWVRAFLARRMLVEGLDDMMALRPDRGVMLVSNHRSFFDQYAMLLACYMGPVHWAKHLYFPVRANFFYDQPLGIFVNAAVAGGAMYPPIYRQAERRALNDDAVDKMVAILKQPGNVLGMHPEGTRGKGPDPYAFLPAQPGVGKLALVAQPVVIPAFIHGLGNNIVEDVKWNFGGAARREHAVIAVFGAPVDYEDLRAEKPRPTLFKKCADRLMRDVAALASREKELRADLLAGRISADDPRWITNRPVGKLYAREGHA